MPAVVADTQLLSGQVAVAVVGAAAVVPAVRDVAGLAFPVLVAFTVHSAGGRVAGGALPVAGAVVGARVDPGQKGREKRVSRSLKINCGFFLHFAIILPTIREQKSTGLTNSTCVKSIKAWKMYFPQVAEAKPQCSERTKRSIASCCSRSLRSNRITYE